MHRPKLQGKATKRKTLKRRGLLNFFIKTSALYRPDSCVLFLDFDIGARVLGDWIFWTQMFPSRMDSGNSTDWRSSVREILFSKTASINAIIDMVVDLGMDALLVYMALKASASPVWIFLVFSACQAVGAPLYGMIIYMFNRKGVRLFSMFVMALTVFAALEINGVITSDAHVDMFGLSSIAKPLAILLVLGAKCLFTGMTVIGKANLAEAIRVETMKELRT